MSLGRRKRSEHCAAKAFGEPDRLLSSTPFQSSSGECRISQWGGDDACMIADIAAADRQSGAAQKVCRHQRGHADDPELQGLRRGAPEACLAGWQCNSATTRPARAPTRELPSSIRSRPAMPSGNPYHRRDTDLRIPVKRSGTTTSGLMIFAGLSPVAGGPYGASIEATHAVERKISHSAAGQTVKEESGSTRAIPDTR